MTKGAHKWHPSEGAAAVPSKKPRVAAVSSVHRSSRAGKGNGGTAEQLKKVGNAITSSHRKKLDAFVAVGEACNPMAPESQTWTNLVSKPQPTILTHWQQQSHQHLQHVAAHANQKQRTDRMSDMSHTQRLDSTHSLWQQQPEAMPPQHTTAHESQKWMSRVGYVSHGQCLYSTQLLSWQ